MQLGLDSLQTWFFSIRERNLPGYPKDFISMTSHGRADIKISHITEEGLDPNLVLTWSGKWYGSVDLRQRILETYQHKGLDIDQVLISHGTNAANYVALQSILEYGDEVIIHIPAWMQAYMVTKHLLKCNVKILRTTHEEGWQINLDKLNESRHPKDEVNLDCIPNKSDWNGD